MAVNLNQVLTVDIHIRDVALKRAMPHLVEMAEIHLQTFFKSEAAKELKRERKRVIVGARPLPDDIHATGTILARGKKKLGLTPNQTNLFRQLNELLAAPH